MALQGRRLINQGNRRTARLLQFTQTARSAASPAVTAPRTRLTARVRLSSPAKTADRAYQYLRAVPAAAGQNVPSRHRRSIRYLPVRQDSADKGERNTVPGGGRATVIGETQPELPRLPGLQ
jgi:hypothetical protein